MLLLLFAFHCPSVVAAQPAPSEPPQVGRPAQFSSLVGSYAIAATAEPTAVAVEEPITLRITITGRGVAKYPPSRKHLKLFPERWAKDFYIEPVPEDDRYLPDNDTWEFVWRLRPRHQQLTVIDGIRLIYYEPNRKKFQTAYAEPIAIAVKPRSAPLVPEHIPVHTAPASFYELPAVAALLAPPASAWPDWLSAALLLAPPLVTLAGVCGLRRLFPERGHRRRWRHSQAARRALQALQGSADEPVWVVFGRYLHERFAFPAEEPTPTEVQRFLRRRGASRPIADRLAVFLGACDAARFAAPVAEPAVPLRDEAGQLICALEEDVCVP